MHFLSLNSLKHPLCPAILSFFLRTFTLANAHTGATQPYLNVVLVLSSQSTLVPVIRDITEM